MKKNSAASPTVAPCSSSYHYWYELLGWYLSGALWSWSLTGTSLGEGWMLRTQTNLKRLSKHALTPPSQVKELRHSKHAESVATTSGLLVPGGSSKCDGMAWELMELLRQFFNRLKSWHRNICPEQMIVAAWDRWPSRLSSSLRVHVRLFNHS